MQQYIHKKKGRCAGCNIENVPIDYICRSYSVCAYCDQIIQPQIANPLNRDLIKIHNPIAEAILYK